jgi:hypothetical protein
MGLMRGLAVRRRRATLAPLQRAMSEEVVDRFDRKPLVAALSTYDFVISRGAMRAGPTWPIALPNSDRLACLLARGRALSRLSLFVRACERKAGTGGDATAQAAPDVANPLQFSPSRATSLSQACCGMRQRNRACCDHAVAGDVLGEAEARCFHFPNAYSSPTA